MNTAADYQATVSAIISVYKAGRFIRDCLDGLIAQTLFQSGQLELVVINSGSPENEDSIIREYVAHYPAQITYVHTTERETIYQAWNRGVQLSRGRYLTNANADDRHREDALEIMARQLDAHPEVSLVYADCDVTTEENGIFGKTRPTGRFCWPDFDPRHLFQICYIGPQPMWRRSLHDRYGMFDATYRSAGDYEFWLRLAAGGEHFLHIPQLLGLYLQSPGGMEHSNQQLSWDESNRARVAHWPDAWGQIPVPAGNYYFTIQDRHPPQTPLVSVIIPTRNRPGLLARAISSVLNQTYPHVEILVVNDGGADVGELISSLNSRRNIRYFNLATGIERSAARNLALNNASGYYVTYLDDDDHYLPEHVETLVNGAIKSGFRVVYTDASRIAVDPAGNVADATARDVPYSIDFDPARLQVENYIPILCLMHERSCLDEAGMFDVNLRRLEDWDLWIRLANVTPFLHIPKVTCEFTWHTGGSSQSQENFPLFLSAYKAICDKYPEGAQRNASVRLWRQSNIFNKTSLTFEFLKTKLAPRGENLNSPAYSASLRQIIPELRTRGISLARIESTICLLKASAHHQEADVEAWLRRALEADEENHPARLELAVILLRRQRIPEALAQLETLHDFNPVDKPIITMLLNTYLHISHNPGKARKLIEKARWLYPNDSFCPANGSFPAG